MSTLSRVVIYVLVFVLITANIYVGQYGLAMLVMVMMMIVEIVPVFSFAKQEPLDYKKLAEAFKTTSTTTSTIVTVKPNKVESEPEPEFVKKPVNASKTVNVITTLANNDKVKAFAAAAAGYAVSKIQEELESDVEEENDSDEESEDEET